MERSWQIGDFIKGRWEVHKVLYGGAGVVYIVYDQAFGEPFAAKTFQDQVFAHSPSVADRFEREALAWIRMDVHPNVTQARMVEKIEGKPFLFLEYVSGGDLRNWIGTPRLLQDLPQVLRFAIQFCDGMIHALSKGIRAHRDIKPANCLISHDGVLKITDFGLVQIGDQTNAPGFSPSSFPGGNFQPALTNAAIGTCTHMAPERFEGPGLADVRSDIYSFGVMLHQMVKGELPFIGKDWKELERLHKTKKPELVSGTDETLADLIQTCLAKKPVQRPNDFGEVRGTLVEIYESVTGTSYPEPAKGSALSAAQLINKGSSLDKLGKRDEALACYDAALQLDSKSARAWFNKGVTLFAASRVQEAMDCYQEALKLDPNSEQAWSNLGVALKSCGKIDEAMTCYDRALKHNPRYPQAWVNKGVALRARGAAEEALVCYDKALKLNPRDATSWVNKGNVLCTLNRTTEAVFCYDQALALDSRVSQAWLNKGIALSALKRDKDALQCFGAAIEVNPQEKQAWFLRGITMVNAFQAYREAVPYLEEAERLGVSEAKNALAFCRTAVLR